MAQTGSYAKTTLSQFDTLSASKIEVSKNAGCQQNSK